mgnify:CR=1 FL=1
MRALDGITLSIRAEEILGIVGQSGSGKSTLLRLINHLEAPSAGTVEVAGVDLAQLSPRDRRAQRRRIGMIFQDFNLLANKTVFDNIALVLSLEGRRREGRRDRVMEVLDYVNMADRAHQHPVQLSGGEQQRVAIARALVTDPDVLLCDEPTSALDPQHTDEVVEILRQVRRDLGTTIVLVSHELELVKTLCDRAAILESGRLTGVTDVSAPAAREAYASYAERARIYLGPKLEPQEDQA